MFVQGANPLYGFCFNRYMVECEFEKMSVGQSRTVVLIDTWWNVNVATVRMEVAMQNCFNRYMVECELHQLLTKQCPLYLF